MQHHLKLSDAAVSLCFTLAVICDTSLALAASDFNERPHGELESAICKLQVLSSVKLLG